MGVRNKNIQNSSESYSGWGMFFFFFGGGGGGVNKISHIERYPCEFSNDDQIPPDPSRSVDMMDKRWVSRVTTSWWALLFFCYRKSKFSKHVNLGVLL